MLLFRSLGVHPRRARTLDPVPPATIEPPEGDDATADEPAGDEGRAAAPAR